MIKQCTMRFGPAWNEGSAQFAWQAGTQPSRATLRFVLGAAYPQIGTLVLSDGVRSASFPNCRVVRHSIRRDGSGGRMREVVVEDRRWMWSRARVRGEFNTVGRSGAIAEDSKKDARALAALCLDAMGETGYNVQAIPDNVYPEVSWDAAEAGPALDEICGQYGCIVVLSFASNRVTIWKNNQGSRPVVDSRAMDSTPSSEPQVVPPALLFEGGPTAWQSELILEPVGIDKLSEKEVVRPVDELTYKPSSGWEGEDPDSLYGVDEEFRDLARKSVFRMFRIKTGFRLSFPPGLLPSRVSQETLEAFDEYFRVDEGQLWRVLPIQTKQVSSAGVDTDGEPRKASLVGAFRLPAKLGAKNNVDRDDFDWDDVFATAPDEEKYVYPKSFSIDAERGLVTTSEPVYYLDGTSNAFPNLRLKTAINLRDPDHRQFVCAQYRFTPSNPTSGATLPEVVKQPDVIFEIVSRDTLSGPGLNNASDFIALAQSYLAERLNALYPNEAISIPYRGFVFDYEVHGGTRSVVWSVGPQGGTTQVDYSIERPDLRLTHTQLREQALQLSTTRQLVSANKRLKKLFKG